MPRPQAAVKSAAAGVAKQAVPVVSPQSPIPIEPGQLQRGPSRSLAVQLQKQRELKCDYVIVRLTKNADGRVVPQLWPLKLNHQVFLQLSFNALKTRCLESNDPRNVCALYRFLMRYLAAMINYQQQQQRRSQHNAPAQRSAISSTVSRDVVTAPPPELELKQTLTEFEKDLRVQLRAEYGVDVAVEGPRLSAEGNVVPDELSEEEFYQQLGRPSGMAQECCVM